MAVNKQAQAIQIANQMFSLSNQLISIYQQMNVIDAAWTDVGAANVLNAMGTVALNADGSTGTADGAPNVANPLDPTKYPTLARSMSSNQIASLKTVLDNVVTYVNGGAVSATVSARAILNGAVGG